MTAPFFLPASPARLPGEAQAGAPKGPHVDAGAAGPGFASLLAAGCAEHAAVGQPPLAPSEGAAGEAEDAASSTAGPRPDEKRDKRGSAFAAWASPFAGLPPAEPVAPPVGTGLSGSGARMVPALGSSLAGSPVEGAKSHEAGDPGKTGSPDAKETPPHAGISAEAGTAGAGTTPETAVIATATTTTGADGSPALRSSALKPEAPLRPDAAPSDAAASEAALPDLTTASTPVVPPQPSGGSATVSLPMTAPVQATRGAAGNADATSAPRAASSPRQGTRLRDDGARWNAEAPSTEGTPAFAAPDPHMATAIAPPGTPGADGSVKTMTSVANGSATASMSSPEASARLRDAIASVANQAVLRGPATGQIVVPELGRVAVRAHSAGGAVDVDVTADRMDARVALRTHAEAMTADLRSADVPIARLTVDRAHSALADSPGSGASARDREGFAQDSSGRAPPQPQGDEEATTPGVGAPSRVRIVL